MPQLAPMSWVFLSFFLFFLLCCGLSGIWWMKKAPLILVGNKAGGSTDKVWSW
uniref:ATP synthase F0 subunit 8 n=1 Tax=Lineus viridis TaxID=56195 RepID=C6GCS5_9BILA|nr:ATP synthase F0 subunit 8 [Lineus viridis]ACO40315.1 ATP synthase F0 subunit 8 [Lineus viridis]